MSSEEFLSSLEQRDVAQVVLKDGTRLEGSYIGQAGMHFLHVKNATLIGKVHGPIEPQDVVSFSLVKPKEEVIAEIRERRLGELVPGRLVQDRDGFQARLEKLANAAAAAPDFRRRTAIEAQFDEVADMISLARTKRNWMLAEARWRRHSNEEPDLLTLAGGDLTVAERFKRPRPQDFHPDPTERRRRHPMPLHVAEDPLSPPNMLKALRRAGFAARVSILSEMTHDSVDLLVDFPGGKKEGRFMVRGSRGDDGAMIWTHAWEGGTTATALTRLARCRASGSYSLLLDTMRGGLAPSPHDLEAESLWHDRSADPEPAVKAF